MWWLRLIPLRGLGAVAVIVIVWGLWVACAQAQKEARELASELKAAQSALEALRADHAATTKALDALSARKDALTSQINRYKSEIIKGANNENPCIRASGAVLSRLRERAASQATPTSPAAAPATGTAAHGRD